MVLVPKGHVGFVHGNQPAIGQSNAKDVAGQVIEDRVLTFSIGFAVRTPLSAPERTGDLLEEFGMILLQRRRQPFSAQEVSELMQWYTPSISTRTRIGRFTSLMPGSSRHVFIHTRRHIFA